MKMTPSPWLHTFFSDVRNLLLLNLCVLILAMLAGHAVHDRINFYFRSVYYAPLSTDIYSFLLLCTAAVFAGLTARHAKEAARSFWLLGMVGLAYLALDDILNLHAKMDYGLHRALDMEETAWSDRLDDALSAMYVLSALGVTWLFRGVLGSYPGFLRLVVAAGMFGLASELLDAAINRGDIMFWLGVRWDEMVRWGRTLECVEDGLKIMAESCAVVAVYRAWRSEAASYSRSPAPRRARGGRPRRSRGRRISR